MDVEPPNAAVIEAALSQNEEELNSSTAENTAPPATAAVNLEANAIPQPSQGSTKEPQKPSPKKPKKRKPRVPRDVTAPRQPLTGLLHQLFFIIW